MIKRVLGALAFTFIGLFCVGTTETLGMQEDASVLVTYLDGTSMVRSPGSTKGRVIGIGERLTKDQEIRVGDRSRLELTFPDGTVMRFSERSTIHLNEIIYGGKKNDKTYSLGFDVGKLWASVKKLITPGSRIEVKTSNAVAGVRGTIYRMNVSDDKSALVRVYDGSVYVRGIPKGEDRMKKDGPPVPVPGPHEVPPPYHEVSLEEWHVIVQSFQQITISPGGMPSAATEFNAQQDVDEWVRWNKERDKRLSF